MNFQLPALLARISDRLSADVLPELPNASWPASHVRSALVLLAYARKMLEDGPGFLSAEIAGMRALLAEAGEGLGASGAEPVLANNIAETLAEPVEGVAIGALQDCFDRHQQLLNAAIDQAHGGALPRELGLRIRDYLKAYAEREKAAFGDVMTMMPL